MKIFYKVNDYDQWLDIYNKNWSCSCPDFIYRQIHKEPIGLCKHVKTILTLLNDEIKEILNETSVRT